MHGQQNIKNTATCTHIIHCAWEIKQTNRNSSSFIPDYLPLVKFMSISKLIGLW